MTVELYQEDCADVFPRLAGRDIYAAVLDPPYGLGENNKRNLSRAGILPNGRKGVPIDYGDFSWDDEPARVEDIATTRQLTKKQIIWGGNYYTLPPSPCWFVWDKENSGDFADCELAWTNLPYAVRIFRHMWNGMIRASEKGKRVHPTQKPLKLFLWTLEKAKFPAGCTILDPYMGSGPCGVAAVLMGYNYIGIEREPKYFKIAQKRIEDAQREVSGLPRQLKGEPFDFEDAPLFAEVV